MTAGAAPGPARVALDALASATTADALAALGSGPTGLDGGEAARRLATNGPNVLAVRRVTAAGVLVRQLRNPLLILLLGAALVSGATGGRADAVIISLIVVLSVGLGFVNELRSERAAAALHADVVRTAVAWRDGAPVRVRAADLVPGDVVDVAVGDIVPADLRLLDATQLECDEGVLTGESLPVDKAAAPVPAGAERPSTTYPSCLYLGTIVHQGSGRALVVGTGTGTEFGRIAVGLGTHPAQTAFQVGLKRFSRLLVVVAGVLTTGIFAINLVLARPLLEALLFSLAIAIGITPQLLPAIVSVSLSSGSRALARKRVLVKRLVTIEDLGNIEVLFTDKTGTLTEGAVTFDRALAADGGPAPGALLLGLVCNESVPTASGPVGGNALDQALWRATDAPALAARPDGPGAYARTAALPFDHERQLASVAVRAPDGTALVVTKGAPESVLARCAALPAEAGPRLDALFADGARVVAVATKRRAAADAAAALTPDDERDLTFAGFLTFVDRPKPGVAASIRRLDRLGIAVKIITGDNGAVAAKVCRDIGMTVDGSLTGAELAALDDERLAELIPHITVFSRVSPEQKSRIVKVARRTGADVAFLGDGVNDAVALHVADVGISVDSGAEVAQDAADIVLLDKDLGVLADGVMEGRRIFANTLKYVLMATSSNFGNMFSAAAASLFLTFLPMLPSQILLNNLLYDVGQLAIPGDDVDAEALARPSAWDISFVRRFMIVFGPISSVFDITTFLVMVHVLHADHVGFRTGWFVESLVTQTLVVFVIRTRRVPFFRSRPSRAMLVTPVTAAAVGIALAFSPLAGTIGFRRPPAAFFGILLAMIAAYLVLVEAAKAAFYRAERHPHRARATHAERHERHVRRRAARFVHHERPRPLRTGRGAAAVGQDRVGDGASEAGRR